MTEHAPEGGPGLTGDAGEAADRDRTGSARDSPDGRAAGARPGRWRLTVERSWRPLTLLAAVLAGWHLVTTTGLIAPYLVPSPAATLSVLTAKWSYLAGHTWVTGYETVLGFLIAAVVGVLSAVVMVYSPAVERTLYPVLLLAQVIPKIAVAPLFVVWLGFGLEPKVLVAVLIAFFPVVISMVTGLKSVSSEVLELAATMGGGAVKTFLKIRFPAALPQLFAGLKVAVTLAVTGAVVGEFVGANEGLGYVILQANGNLDTPVLFAGLILMSLIGVLLFALLELAERLVLPWHVSRRADPVTTR